MGHARGVRGPKSTVPSSANLVGSVAAERSYRAFGAPVPSYSMLGGECSLSVLGLMLVPMFFSFLLIVPISLLSGPFVSSRIPCFVPKRRSQRGVVVSRASGFIASGFIAPNLAFYRPHKAQLDMIGQLVHHMTSGD